MTAASAENPPILLSLVVQSAGRRDFTSAADVARGIGLALDLPPDGRYRVYNVATGIGT